MTLLCGGLHNEARVPEFRLPAGNAATLVIPAVKPLPHRECWRAFTLSSTYPQKKIPYPNPAIPTA